jgi:MFS family permease
VVSSLASGLIIATLGMRWTWHFTTIAMVSSAVFSLFLIEPKRMERKFNIRNYYNQIIESIKFIIKNKRLSILTINAALTGCIGTIGFWFYQPHMRASGIPIELFGIVFAGFSICAAFSAKFAHHFEKRLDLRKIVWISPFLSAIAFIGLATFFSPIISIPMIFILQFVRGFSGPTLTTLSNHVMPSHMRATINSIGGMISRTFFVALGPLFGLLSDSISISFAILMVALVASIQIPLFGIRPEKVRK